MDNAVWLIDLCPKPANLQHAFVSPGPDASDTMRRQELCETNQHRKPNKGNSVLSVAVARLLQNLEAISYG